MISEYWILASWITQVMLYLGTAFVLGGVFSCCLFAKFAEIHTILQRYMLIGATLGLISTVLGFLIQIGSFANQGIAGMWDTTYFNILMETSIGKLYGLRALCFAVILLLLLSRLKSKTLHTSWRSGLLPAVFLIPVVISFSQLGHTANLGYMAQGLLALHVLGVFLWMGALYPLWKLNGLTSGQVLQDRMHLFGRIAVFIVATLMVSGISIAVFLFQDWKKLLGTAYGQGFILKILLVFGILLIAALNKFYFTPRLQSPKTAKLFGNVILLEMAFGFAILLLIGYITLVIGME